MFDVTKLDLREILRKVHKGQLQLPDFQRDYVWGEDDVHGLIASIGKGFPVGALLTLETGGVVEFKPRLLAGVPATADAPTELLLDGQQRMTSLYQTMYSDKPVQTKTKRGTYVDRWFYIDIKAAVGSPAQLDEAIVGLPADRVVRTNFGKDVVLDLSTPEQEYELDHFPLHQVFDSRDWLYGWRDYWRAKQRDVSDLDRSFVETFIKPIEHYKMPIIRLDADNSREAVCVVFERINVGGKKLDAFELLTAIYAARNFDLRADWHGLPGGTADGRLARMIGRPHRRDVLSKLAATDFLQACTVLHTRDVRLRAEADPARDKDLPQVSCNRDALLGLPLDAYRNLADRVEKGFVAAGAFLNEMKIIWHHDVPYPTLTVGLAAVFAALDDREHTAQAKRMLEQWFWSIVFGEQYGSSTETRLARDVPELIDWIRGKGPAPRALGDAVFQESRLHSLRSRLSAAYKGLHARLMQRGCRDFKTGRPADVMTFFNDRIDIHHIFPQAWCKKHGIPAARYNSIINKTPLARATNGSIGGDAPSVYLKRIEVETGVSAEHLDDLLRTHLIDPALLRADDFEGFWESRKRALAGLVADGMCKAVVPGEGGNEPETDAPADEADDSDEELD